MTSTNDGKNVKSNQSSSSKGKSFYIELYKSLDGRLSSEGDLRQRTQHLCEAWRRIHSLCQHSASSTHPHLLSWLQRHTARTILQTEWQKPESKPYHGNLSEAIEAFIEDSRKTIANRNGTGPSWESQLLQRAEWFKNVLSNPWGHPILRLLSNPTGEKPSDKEVLEWLKEERGVMFVTRLRQLATAKTCVDIACALVAAVMDRVRASVGNPEEDIASASVKKEPTFADILKTEAGFTVDVWELLTDLEFVLLFKGENRSRCIELAKQTPLRSGYQLVERLHSRLEMSPREKKLWKNAKEVAILIAQVVIARCMVVPTCTGVARTALYCCTRSLVRLLPPARLPTAANALAAPAATARHLHTLASAVDAQGKEQMKPFVCELFVRAITTGMNELERLKLKVEKESEARAAEQTLSSWFTQLGTLLSKSPRLNYECALTAFSVHPSPSMYERILAAPDLPPQATSAENHETVPESNSEFGSWATDSRTKTNFVKTSETLNIKQIQCNTNILSTAVLSEGEAIGLGPELCQDLAVLLSGLRHKTLSWDMNRDIMLENCKTYMERTNGGTRALTTELKYLNLDPRSFQHLPEEEEDEDNIYYGIEKGYEHLVEFQEAEHIWQNAFDDSITEDSLSSDGFDGITSSVRRKKKKTKKAKNFSDTEIDPLCTFIDDHQYGKKKERPHSKERSKERLQMRESENGKEEKDPLKVISDKKLQNKGRKERKKRDKDFTAHVPKVGSLSKLIGMKVARVENLHVQEKLAPQSNENTDNTSQRKLSMASLNSDGSDTNVVFDGLYAMDDIKSPEKSLKSFEKSNHNAVLFPPTEVSEIKTEINDKLLSQKTDSTKVQNIANQSQATYILSSNTFNPITNTKLHNNIVQGKQLNEDVKQNIKKLIEFRKYNFSFNKKPDDHELQNSSENLLLFKNNTVSNQGSVANSKEVKGPMPIKSSPAIPCAVKHTFNRSKSKQSTFLKSEGISSIGKSHMGNMISHSTAKSYVGTVVSGLARYTNSVNETKEKDIDKQILSCTESYVVNTKKNMNNEKFEEKVSVGNNKCNNKQNVSNDRIFQDFLRELKETINAGAIKDKSEMHSALHKHTHPVNKIRDSPCDKNIKGHTAFSSQCAKRLVQEKKADVPNTFARLNYMHRNKNCDLKSKLPTCQTKQSNKPTSEFEQHISDHKINKIDYLQSRGNLTISRIGNMYQNQKPNAHVSIQKKLSKEHTCLSNILQANTVKTNNMLTKTQINKELINDTTKYQERVNSQTSFLAEKDQQDLVLLLRQQNKLNAVKSDIKSGPKMQHIAQLSSLGNTESNSYIYSDLVSAGTKKLSHNEMYKGKPPGTSTSLNNLFFEIDKKKTIEKPTSAKDVNSSSVTMFKTHTSSCKKNRQIKSEGKVTGKKETATHKFSPVNTATKQDWESVMDAILKHKTPRRGPSALDIALNRDSFGQLLTGNNMSSQKDALLNFDEKQPKTIKNELKGQKVLLPSSAAPISSNFVKKKLSKYAQKPISVPKPDIDHLPKLEPSDLSNKEVAYSVIKNHDPFISGIPNSDYDLLEELMDDDLKKEIGELFSDEDTFGSVGIKKENQTIFETKAKTITPFQKDEYDKSLIQGRAVEYQNARAMDLKNENSPSTETTKTVATDVRKHTKNPNCAMTQCLDTNFNFKTPTVTSNTEINKTVLLSHTNINESSKISHRQRAMQDNIVRKKSTDIILDNKCNDTSVKTNVLNSKNHNRDINQTFCTNNNFHTNLHNLNCKNGLPGNMTTSQNVVVIAPKVIYDIYPTTPAENIPNTSLQNFHPSSYVSGNTNVAAVNTNVPILQSTHLVTPIITPIISDNASTISGLTNHTLQILDIPTSVNSSQLDIELSSRQLRISTIKEVPTLLHQHISKVNFEGTSDIKIKENFRGTEKSSSISTVCKIDPIINRERKILSLVQKNFKSYDKIERRLCSTIDHTVEHNSDEKQRPKESEKLKHKRLTLMNRNISHHSDISPIPLPYWPLKLIELTPTIPENSNLNINNDHLNLRNIHETTSVSQEVLCSRENDNSCIYNTDDQITPKEKVGEGIVIQTLLDAKVSEKCKENKSSKSFCRRIVLRPRDKCKNHAISFNEKSVKQEKCKVKSKLKPENSYEKDTLATKIKSKAVKTSTTKHSNFENVVKEKNSVVECTDNKDNTAINKSENLSRANVNTTDNVICINKSVETSIDTQFFDVEDKLIRSVIPKLNRPTNDVHSTKEVSVIKTNGNNEEKENLVNTFQTDVISKFDQNHIKSCGHNEATNLQNNLIEPTSGKNQDVDNSNKNIDESIYRNNSTDPNITKKLVTNTEKGVRRKRVFNQSKLITNFSPAKKCHQNINYKLNKKPTPNKGIHVKDINKLIFKEITPLKTKNPNKKTFRVKLPDGKRVKATITGNGNYDVNNILSHPDLKDLLLNGALKSGKCTFKKIPGANLCMVESSQNIIKEKKTINTTQVMETINLVSDDEDDYGSRSKSGFDKKHNVFLKSLLSNEALAKHERKLSENCSVSLKRYTPEQLLALFEKKRFTQATEIEKDNSTVLMDAIYNNNIEENTNHLLSNQDISFDVNTENCNPVHSTKNNNICPLVTEESIKESHQQDLENLTSEILSEHNQFDEKTSVFDSNEISKRTPNNLQCYLKLTRCDNLVKKYERMKLINQECFVELVRCDNTFNEKVSTISSSLNQDDNTANSKKIIIDNEIMNDHILCNYIESEQTFKSNTESNLTRSDSCSMLDELFVQNIGQVPSYEKVIDKQNFTGDVKFNPKETLFSQCDAEWTTTKRRIADCKITDEVTIQMNNENYADVSTDFESDEDYCALADCKDLKEYVLGTKVQSITEVPSLKKIVLKVFENSRLIDRLQQFFSRNMLVVQKQGHLLKRKNICNEDISSSCKMLKVGRSIPLEHESLLREVNKTKSQVNATTKFVKTNNDVCDIVLPCTKYEKNDIILKNKERLYDLAHLPEEILHVDTKFKVEYPNTITFNEASTLKNDDNKDISQNNSLVNKTINSSEEYEVEYKSNEDHHELQELIKNGLNNSITNTEKHVAKEFDNQIMQPEETILASCLDMQVLSTNTTTPNVNNQNEKDNGHKINENLLELFVEDNNEQYLYSNDCNSKNIIKRSDYEESVLSCEKVSNVFSADLRRTDNTFNESQKNKTKIKNKNEINPNEDKFTSDTRKDSYCNIKETTNLNPELIETQSSTDYVTCETIGNDNTTRMKEINSLTTNHFIDEAEAIDVNKLENGRKTSRETFKISTFGKTLSNTNVTSNAAISLNMEHDYVKTAISTLNKTLSNTNVTANVAISLNMDHDYVKTATLSDFNNWDESIKTKNTRDEISGDTQHAVTITNKENDKIIVENVQKQQKIAYDVISNVTLIYKDNPEVVLKGIEYEDPFAGTCYMFPLETSTMFTEEIDNVDTICTELSNIDYDTETTFTKNKSDTLDDEKYSIIIPKKTYSRFYKVNKNCCENLSKKAIKRKRNCQDFKTNKKRYRKSKNIDYLKNSAAIQNDLTYSKEFKRLCDYYNSLKFSYSRSFHKEYIDVSSMIKCWPVQNTLLVPSHEEVDNIFEDNYELKCFPDPTKQTLVEELSSNYTDIPYEPLESGDTNFNMGFGEESGRVIQNLEKKKVYSKFSAATLSDVKQSQPFLLSEDHADCENTYEIPNFNSTKEDQKKKLKHYITYIQLRDKVRSFFKKTSLELKYSWIRDNLKDNDLKWKFNGKNDSTNNPFDFYIHDFIEPPPLEAVVQVVQVGQLPVSAAAQNPVSCDPRVTHVSDASPPQCSMENSLNDDSQSAIKTEYTELTTADLTIPLVAEYEHHEDRIKIESDDTAYASNNEITIQFENEFIPKIEPKEEKCETDDDTSVNLENKDLQLIGNNHIENSDYSYDTNINNEPLDSGTPAALIFDPPNVQNGTFEKTDQIAHAMNAAGIIPTAENDSICNSLGNTLSPKVDDNVNTNQDSEENFRKTSINAMALQQALAQILPPPLNQTNNIESDQKSQDTTVPQQVLHIVQGKNVTGNQITLVESGLVDSSQQSVINTTNATPVLHIVQNKGSTSNANCDETSLQHTNAFSSFSLVDTGLPQGTNQLLHIVNTGNQKGNNSNQILKRVNLLTNLTNVQGSNEQKMLQFVCKSADGKAIQLNAPHQRSMVLRLQPIESQHIQSSLPKNDDHSPTPTTTQQESSEDVETTITQQEIKSRSIYEENYAKFIQNTSNQQCSPESTTSLPKFNQAFGKPVFQDGPEKHNEMSSNLSSVNSDNSECETSDNAINLDHIGQINSPPLLIRKSPQSSQTPSELVQQIKQTITPMNIQTMHGGVIYTRQIPVNIGGGQTINLITVPTTDLIDDSNQKQSDIKFINHSDIEPSIIKIVAPNQAPPNSELSHEEGNNARTIGDNGQNTQTQPILTQMRIKLPMLSKTPQMVTGARVVRPSFFQIQRNVIGGTNQPVYQQLVLTTAPPLGQQTIRLPQAQMNRQVKVPTESSEPQMSSSTLEQLREFDMVLEQVKERSTVQPNMTTNNSISKLNTTAADATDSASTGATTEPTQVLYSIGTNQQFNVAYVNRKSTVTNPPNSTFVRSPDSSSINETPTTSTQVQLPQTVTAETTPNETPAIQQNPPKPKITSRSRSRPKASSNPPNTLKLNSVPPKTSSQKPLEDEQTTQRILYILAEYKEQVENSPDKDKPAPRRRTNPPTPGSSKRKKSHSRRPGARDMSPIHGDDTCRTMGSEDSSCGTSQGDCNENCLDIHSPQDSPRKIVKKLSFEQETPPAQNRPQPQRNVIVADGQTITVARGTGGKPTTAVLMPANYILPVSVVKGGQQIAIVTNRGPKLLTVAGSEGGTTNALLLQRLIGPAGLKPMLARPGVRHVRLPTASLHNLQAFNLATAATTVQPPDSTASPAPSLNPPELIETKASSSPWPERETQEVIKPVRTASPDASEPWNVPSSADVHDYTYEETVRTDNLDRTVLEPIPDRYSPDMEAQRIFDKMFDVDSKKSYNVDSHDESPRCEYDIDASECDDKCYHQVVQKNISSQRQHRLTHVSAAALRHKYAILEHELRLQKSLSEECEDLGVDSPSASELFPEAELLFAGSPAHEQTQDHTAHRTHTPQPTILSQGVVPRPDIDDQIATDQLLQRNDIHDDNNDLDVNLGLDDVGIVTVTENGATITLDQEEFARSHPNTTFHSEEPIDDGEMQPYTISGIKGPHITSTIFHANRAPATVLMGPQTTVISQATNDNPTIQHNIKYSHIDNIINTPSTHQNNLNLSSVLVKDDGLTRFDSILTDSRELHLSNTASAIVHSSHNATQVIRRVCYDEDKRDSRYLMDEQDTLIAGDDAKMIAEDSSRDATLESIAGDVDDYRSSPERHTELYWESNSTSERSESRRPLDFSSDSDKCCKSPSYDETNSTDSSGVGAHMRLDSVIKDARGIDRSGSADGSSADDTHPPLRTYPAKRLYHALDGDTGRSLTGKTRAGERSPDSLEIRRRASGRGVVKRCCHCCNGSPIPPRPKKPRQRKPAMDFSAH